MPVKIKGKRQMWWGFLCVCGFFFSVWLVSFKERTSKVQAFCKFPVQTYTNCDVFTFTGTLLLNSLLVFAYL